MKRHGGRRPGAGRPKQPTVREVALMLSKPSNKPSVGTAKPSRTEEYVSAEYRPSKASARRSAIPAAAVRARGPERTIWYRKRALPPREADVRDWLEQKGCRSLSSLEMQFADILDAQCANTKTTCNRQELQQLVPEHNLAVDAGRKRFDDGVLNRPDDPVWRTLADCGLDGIRYNDPTATVPGREPGSSLGDFLMEDFYDGTKQPGELRGIKRTDR